ncbi:MAG: hypothetical protein DI540_10350 [Sphingobium sp.]|nr:MAG: hypothetical protein DI540_10350 [Sphingobium sp.]
MQSTAIVQFDGMSMPLDTFIDCYRLIRVNSFALPSMASNTRLVTVDRCGTVIEDCRANQVDWHACIAFRPVDGQQEHEPCFDCGTSPDDQQFCESCMDDMEYGW